MKWLLVLWLLPSVAQGLTLTVGSLTLDLTRMRCNDYTLKHETDDTLTLHCPQTGFSLHWTLPCTRPVLARPVTGDYVLTCTELR